MYAGILAGGSGSRMWPLSREQYLKQYLDQGGKGVSLFQQIVARVAPLLSGKHIYVVTPTTRTMKSGGSWRR